MYMCTCIKTCLKETVSKTSGALKLGKQNLEAKKVCSVERVEV